MNEGNMKGLLSAAALLGLTIWVGTWWMWLPALIVFGLCLFVAVSAGHGPAVPRSELGGVEECLRDMQRSLDGR